jgi:hypothetical protein
MNTLTAYTICSLIAFGVAGIFWCLMEIISFCLNRYIRNKQRKEQHRIRERILKEHAGEKIVDIRTKQLYKKDGTQ